MSFRFGLENFHPARDSGRIGMVTNITGVTLGLVHNVDYLRKNGANIVKIFSPEHGFYSTFANGENVPDEDYHGIPVRSLYKEDSKEMDVSELDDIDTLIFDVQDAGVRFYTYLSTLYRVMEAAKKKSTSFMLLDRPNPLNSDTVSGPMLEPEYRSFVGIDTIPVRYGMTIGELAHLFDRNIGAEPTIIRMTGYKRKAYYDELVSSYTPLSWNLPTVDSVINYSGMCLLESINASLGRGTPHPFSIVGFPGLWSLIKNEFPGVMMRETEFTPLLDPLKGRRVQGYYIHITDRRDYDPLSVWAGILYDLLESEKCELREDWNRLLYGSNRLLETRGRDAPFAELVEGWADDLNEFLEIRSNHLIY